MMFCVKEWISEVRGKPERVLGGHAGFQDVTGGLQGMTENS